MSNLTTLNCSCPLETNAPIKGMIDAHTYHITPATWPAPLRYAQLEYTDDGTVNVNFTDISALKALDGINVRQHSTTVLGGFIVGLNSRMYNNETVDNPDLLLRDIEELSQIREEIRELLNGRHRESITNKKERERLRDLEKRGRKLMTGRDFNRRDIPSLIIAPTMDMELAHFDGYDGELIYREDRETGKVLMLGQPVDDDTALMFKNWNRQISDVEAAVASNPMRLFPLFSYDPRRYRLPNEESPGDNGCAAWDKPFARIVGCGDSDANVKKIWLGFCMNPSLGFRPFDEYCEHLPRFYKKCVDNDIPILAHCAPGGITSYDAKYYSDDLDDRLKKSEKRHKMILKENLSTYKNDALSSCMYYGGEQVVDDLEYSEWDYFYKNYGHPRNWIPVLEYFPNLRLCLSGFGGNTEWQRAGWFGNGDSNSNELLPTRQWLRCIIKLTAKYENVYADLSGLNIYDDTVRSGILEMLRLSQDEKNEEFKHLKDKLIFGSGWYLTSLTDVSAGGRRIGDQVPISHSYSNYCREFKDLFSIADIEGKGTLWERISLINAWNFYGFDSKISEIHDKLVKNGNGDVDTEMLKRMKDVFDGSEHVAGLVEYIKNVA